VKCAASGQGVQSTAAVANWDLLLKMCGGALLVCHIFADYTFKLKTKQNT